MRKVSKEAAHAFKNDRKFKNGNTEVKLHLDEVKMYLHGNLIARKKNGTTYISDGGWSTATTKDRLNAILSIGHIRMFKGDFIFNKEFVWDGNWLDVTKYV